MAILLKVKWVDRVEQAEPHQRIRHIGGVSRELQWKHSQADAIEFIERDLFSYCVENNLSLARLNVIQSADGKKYLTVEADAGQQQLLFNLPQSPQETSALK